ncbi:hypothetical protein T08_15954 [Trichinella sp. T8]|nr:hypothetical protein T08_15954 [Trichinella sp. T8]
MQIVLKRFCSSTASSSCCLAFQYKLRFASWTRSTEYYKRVFLAKKPNLLSKTSLNKSHDTAFKTRNLCLKIVHLLYSDVGNQALTFIVNSFFSTNIMCVLIVSARLLDV